MIKTAIENKQNLVIEGCYIPFDWKKDFSEEYLREIRYYCLIMSEAYIRKHFDNIAFYESVIEMRLEACDEWCTRERILEDNLYNLRMCMEYGCDYIMIEGEYRVDIEL